MKGDSAFMPTMTTVDSSPLIITVWESQAVLLLLKLLVSDYFMYKMVFTEYLWGLEMYSSVVHYLPSTHRHGFKHHRRHHHHL